MFLIFAVYYYATTSDTLNIGSTKNYLVFLLIILIGLALVYQLLVNYLSKLRGFPGFIAQLLFYIPCVFNDIIAYLLEQVHMTSYSTYALLIIEILLIVIYAYLPEIPYKFTGQDNSIQLLTNIKYLDEGKQIIAGSDVLKIPRNINEPASKEHYLNNYCIRLYFVY